MGNIGFSLKVGAFELDLFLGDFWLKVPKVCEVAWNRIGFFFSRL